VANHTPHRDFAGVLYLNNVHAGCRLQFERNEIDEVVPAAGLYVTFPCGPDYVHQVEPVARGDRFTLAMWFTTSRDHAHPVLNALISTEVENHHGHR
jgi:hypothetical protein